MNFLFFELFFADFKVLCRSVLQYDPVIQTSIYMTVPKGGATSTSTLEEHFMGYVPREGWTDRQLSMGEHSNVSDICFTLYTFSS